MFVIESEIWGVDMLKKLKHKGVSSNSRGGTLALLSFSTRLVATAAVRCSCRRLPLRVQYTDKTRNETFDSFVALTPKNCFRYLIRKNF